MLTKREFYGGICLASLGSGIARGFCREKGVDLPMGVDPLLIYSMPLVGMVGGFVREYIPYSGGSNSVAGLFPFFVGGLGAAGGGLGAIVSGVIGTGIGHVAGKLI